MLYSYPRSSSSPLCLSVSLFITHKTLHWFVPPPKTNRISTSETRISHKSIACLARARTALRVLVTASRLPIGLAVRAPRADSSSRGARRALTGGRSARPFTNDTRCASLTHSLLAKTHSSNHDKTDGMTKSFGRQRKKLSVTSG